MLRLTEAALDITGRSMRAEESMLLESIREVVVVVVVVVSCGVRNAGLYFTHSLIQHV